MGNGVSNSTDKNIVDLSRSHRNKATAKALRMTRERLHSTHGGTPAFEKDLLSMHTQASLHGAAITPFITILTAGLTAYLSGSPIYILWALLTLSIHALNILLIRKAAKRIPVSHHQEHWRHVLLAGHLAMGCCWAAFTFQTCAACGPTSDLLLKGSVLLVVLCTTAMTNILLRQAVLYAFTPPIIALSAQAFFSQRVEDATLALAFTVSVLFFIYITGRLYVSNLKLISFQSEKDDLIAELEVAKSMSDEARRRAEEANMAKSRFLASMSHELRTPLNAILGFSEVMAQEVLGPLNNPLYREYSGDIHRSGQHLLNLINEILDLSRIEAGKYDLSEESISLLEIAEDCVGMVQLRAKAKDIKISQQYEINLPALWADEKALRQVVLNLLSNAVKFTPPGGEILVKVGWTVGGGQYVSIKDNGPGIAEEEIPVVLSAFGQGSIAIKSAEQGTGLGLPIVQAILAKHGGEFKLKSKLREGTEVIAILPAKRVLQTIPAVQGTQAVEPKRRYFA
ncbi:sensor histidine kinase [Agrobacterium vitis]|uniref:sensor histidine kinase n=1 Tax=Agrobacterium vitis TaxID=373 RepID=UPI0008732FA2|nr:HAMP domain-containing sensor histidine kinase [Agrobacterium vitis]MCE6077151.1 sensor histidine kinase [Agrobacterium vitis]MCM2469126.1 HAMP domain-containing histidine kinase [Agrobacterium vitis]MUO69472.1 sensor histidine kinase [Agrobacterium vitis]MUO87323.1 sensor histidine kinase [Agrobacterium vitis]MVA36541.1 sensor histidine kinase [Agrobacterium vitis]